MSWIKYSDTTTAVPYRCIFYGVADEIRYCPYCGAYLGELNNFVYCPYCGEHLSARSWRMTYRVPEAGLPLEGE